MHLTKILFHHQTKVYVIFKRMNLFFRNTYSHSGRTYQDDQRLHNLFYRKSKLESVNETSALLSGFAIVQYSTRKRFIRMFSSRSQSLSCHSMHIQVTMQVMHFSSVMLLSLVYLLVFIFLLFSCPCASCLN